MVVVANPSPSKKPQNPSRTLVNSRDRDTKVKFIESASGSGSSFSEESSGDSPNQEETDS